MPETSVDLEESMTTEAEEIVSPESERSTYDVIDTSCSTESSNVETVHVGTPPEEDPIVPSQADEELTGLIDQWLQVKRSERLDSEDMCSTNDSETPASIELDPSDVSSETNEPFEPSEVQTKGNMPIPDAPQVAKPLGWQGQSKMSSEEAKAQAATLWQLQQQQYQQQCQAYQAAAAQWQMAQSYQAAAAQWQMAQWQHVQQWQMAQRYHHQQQQLAHNAAINAGNHK